MNLSLNDILTLTGRLDDAPGFDTPRERFRRLLTERVADAAAARSLIEQTQRTLGEQHHRALQDIVVLVGQFLGFETTFGTYQRAAGVPKFDGHWRSRRRLEVVLDIRSDYTPRTDVHEITRVLADLPTPLDDPNVRHLAFCIITPLYGGRARLEDGLNAETQHADLRVVSIRSLLWLADMVSAGRMKHHEIVRLFLSGANLDFIVDFMEQFADGQQRREEEHPASTPAPVPVPAPAPLPTAGDHSFWVAAIDGDDFSRPEQLIESVVRRRHLLGVRRRSTEDGQARTGDWICLLVDRKEIVGHAQIDSVVDGMGLIRSPEQFSAVFRLRGVQVYERSLSVGPEVVGRLVNDDAADGRGPLLCSVDRDEFLLLTGRDPAAALERQTGGAAASSANG